jgi:hypothetical protein
MADEKLVREFDEAMHDIYRRAHSEANYKAARFLEMLHEHRGLEAARILLHAPRVSEGYTSLYLQGRLDLTVEAVIHDNAKWHDLFSPEDLNICRTRLQDHEYFNKGDASENQPSG